MNQEKNLISPMARRLFWLWAGGTGSARINQLVIEALSAWPRGIACYSFGGQKNDRANCKKTRPKYFPIIMSINF